ncbi:4'-phosphopantetheinyl transferase family protein [Parendozoicomonas haliclonae]|uniref:Enterobactin synthase component D n=1 Tax=Parendozoicomonas haliclonae TaxID=1960125 RepID=A0A1X7AGB6_9GAMM|nr:4'-phosphopantetheinyl transferase superfamily protein [Parendozoicomonas haliclonae]SMA38472.1 4'-phosphopantetheinyl transferase Npt [Parendozoicomonas haliclonae]
MKPPLPDIPHAYIHAVEFSYTENDRQFLRSCLPASCLPPKGCVLKREIEFYAGRVCVQNCYAAFGLYHVLPIPDICTISRAPQWPEGFTGSISHCSGLAVAIVSHNTSYSSLGIDIEQVPTQERAVDLADMVLTNREHTYRPLELNFSEWFALVFSAKESLYKMLYPITRCQFDFLDASLQNVFIKNDKRRFSITVKTRKILTPCEFNGVFAITDGFIWTMIPLESNLKIG